MHEFEVVLYS